MAAVALADLGVTIFAPVTIQSLCTGDGLFGGKSRGGDRVRAGDLDFLESGHDWRALRGDEKVAAQSHFESAGEDRAVVVADNQRRRQVRNCAACPARSSNDCGKMPRPIVIAAHTAMAALLQKLGITTWTGSACGSVKNISTITRT